MQHKTKSLPQQATYWLGVIAVGLTVGLGIQFAQAWTNPGQAPEQGDIPGPITTGGDQTKDGSLRLSQNKNLSVGNAYLSSGGNYTHLANNEWFNGAAWVGTAPGALLQMNGQSVYFYRHDGKGNHSLLGTVASNGGVGGHYFYDLNDGNYYVDPTNWSRVAAVAANHYHSYGGARIDGNVDANDYYIRAIGKWASQVARPTLTQSYKFESFCGSSGSTNPHSFCAMSGVYQHGNNGLLRLIPGAPNAQGKRVYTLSVTRPTGCSDGALHIYVDCFDF